MRHFQHISWKSSGTTLLDLKISWPGEGDRKIRYLQKISWKSFGPIPRFEHFVSRRRGRKMRYLHNFFWKFSGPTSSIWKFRVQEKREEKEIEKWGTCKKLFGNPQGLSPMIWKFGVQEKAIEKLATCKKWQSFGPTCPLDLKILCPGEEDKNFDTCKLKDPKFFLA